MSKVSVGGYHHRFVKADQIMDMYMCKVCRAVSRDPYETVCCKNTFCKSCIDKSYTFDFWGKTCPTCCAYLEITKAIQIHRSIQHLEVYCDYKEEGCQWIGTVETIDKHVKKCPYQPVSCEYWIVGCKAKIARHCQFEHNEVYKKKHLDKVLGCVQELKNTKQQLEDTVRKLTESNEEKNNQRRIFEQELRNVRAKLANTKRKLTNTEVNLADTEIELVKVSDEKYNEFKLVLLNAVSFFVYMITLFTFFGLLIYYT